MRGPGETPFRELVKAWGKKRTFDGVRDVWTRTEDGEYAANMDPIKIRPHFKYNSPVMDERPQPRRDLVEEFRDDYFFLFYPKVYSVETARGCRYQIGTDMLFEQIPAYLEFFGFPSTTADDLRKVAKIAY